MNYFWAIILNFKAINFVFMNALSLMLISQLLFSAHLFRLKVITFSFGSIFVQLF